MKMKKNAKVMTPEILAPRRISLLLWFEGLDPMAIIINATPNGKNMMSDIPPLPISLQVTNHSVAHKLNTSGMEIETGNINNGAKRAIKKLRPNFGAIIVSI